MCAYTNHQSPPCILKQAKDAARRLEDAVSRAEECRA